MTDVLTIADFILSNLDNVSTCLIIVALIVAVAIGIAEYKSRLWGYITNRRNRNWFIFDLLTFAFIIICLQNHWIRGYWLIGTAILWGVYTISIIISLKPKRFMGYSNLILKRYEKWLSDGSSIEHIDYFRKPSHWYLYTAEDKLEYHMLRCSYFADVKEFDNAYKSLDKINNEWLYECEKETIKLQRAMLLTQMGSMKAAYHLLGDPEKSKSNNPMVWVAYSFIYENAGDIDKALIYAEKSRDIVESGYKAPDFVISEIYNNYARVAIFKGNRQEALRYLDIAWKRVKASKDMRTIHIIASNRILQMAIVGKSKTECQAALKEYKELIPNDSFMNKVEYNNCEIIYYRQIKDTKKENDLIKKGYNEVICHLNLSQKVLYTASTFRMLMDGHFDHKWFDKYVKVDKKEYEAISLMDRLVAFNEYIDFFQQEEFRTICNRDPYKSLKKYIMKYYKEEAIKAIDAEIAKVESYNRFLYKNLMMMKLAILKLIEGKSHIDRSKGIYVDLCNELYDAGLHLDAIRVLLTLINECSSAYNVLILSPSCPSGIYYSDILEGTDYPPDPKPDPDGVHLQYYRLQFAQPVIVQPLHDDIIIEYIDTIISEFRNWKNHPFKVELSIEIAHLLMCLGRKKDAREFLQFFKNSNVSENQMGSWVREEIEALEADLEQ